jgi:hypothetical protein
MLSELLQGRTPVSVPSHTVSSQSFGVRSYFFGRGDGSDATDGSRPWVRMLSGVFKWAFDNWSDYPGRG